MKTLIGCLNRLVGLFRCKILHLHLMEYSPRDGYMGGIFAPCKCARCGYKHPGFKVPPMPKIKSNVERENS